MRMKIKVLFAFFCLLFQNFISEAQDFTRFYADSAELQSATRFLPLANGKFWIGGNRLPSSGDELKAWVCLLDNSGFIQKRFRFNLSGYQTLAGMGLLPDGRLTCVFSRKAISGITENYVAILDSQQIFSVQRIADADNAVLDDAFVDYGGKVLVCGFKGFPDPEGNNFFVTRIQPLTGASDWIFDNGVSQNDHIKNVIQTADGRYAVCGDVQQDTYNPYVAKLDTNGQLIWDIVLTSPWNDGSQKLAEDSLGRIWLVGETSTSAGPLFDNALSLISPGGQLLWQQVLGSEGQDAAFLIRKAGTNGFWVGGYSNASTSGQGPISPYLMRLNSLGQSLGEAFWPFTSPSPVYDFAVQGDTVFYFCGISGTQAYFMKRTQPALNQVFVTGTDFRVSEREIETDFYSHQPIRLFDVWGRGQGFWQPGCKLQRQGEIFILRNAKGQARKILPALF